MYGLNTKITLAAIFKLITNITYLTKNMKLKIFNNRFCKPVSILNFITPAPVTVKNEFRTISKIRIWKVSKK